MLYYTVLYCTVLYCTVLYCTVLYCTVLYYTVLYYESMPQAREAERLYGCLAAPLMDRLVESVGLVESVAFHVPCDPS